MNVKTWLALGRVSNLPTVWTNVLAAGVLAGSLDVINGDKETAIFTWMLCLLGLSLMYLSGMFLNDAFDADWDKQHNKQRPIVIGKVEKSMVWRHGIAMMISAILIIGAAYTPQMLYGWLAPSALAGVILLYNIYHKEFIYSAVIMGVCRFGVYLLAGTVLAGVTEELLFAGGALLIYIAALTYIAREEEQNRLTRCWPLLLLLSPVIAAFYIYMQNSEVTWVDSIFLCASVMVFVAWVLSRLKRYLYGASVNIKHCIGGLLAAIPLIDCMMLASVNAWLPALICFVVFITIPSLHRWVSGT